jgi:AcrR family transcriptional regulator
MRDIQAVTGLHPGSIYTSFGSKEALFKEALQNYSRLAKELLNQHVATNPSPIAALKSFIKDVVVEQGRTMPSEHCMLVKSIAELTEDNPILLAESRDLLANLGDLFALLLSKAQGQGEVSTERTPQRLARMLQMQIMGLRAFASTNQDDQQVLELIDDLFLALQY